MSKIRELIERNIMDPEMDFRVRLFNVMAAGGATVSFFTFIQSMLTNMLPMAGLSFFMMCLSIGLLGYAARTGKYYRCYIITIVVIFLLLFPLLFFMAGGYRSGVPAIFIFAVMFTVMMLEGVPAVLVSLLELGIYGFICHIAYVHPEYVVQYSTEKEIFSDIIFSYSLISVILGMVLFLHIREYRHQREKLQEQNEILKHYDDVKSTFLTTVAHEIKNPLNVIGLHAYDTAELADEEPVDLKQIKENQEMIKKTVMRIDRIVVDLMDTVSIEQGRLKLALAPMDTAALIKESVKFWSENDRHESINGNKIKLDLRIDPAPVVADYARLFQVMTNLLSNASRHTKEGTITVTLRKSGKHQVVTVKDTGKGMPPDIRRKALNGYVSTNKDYWRHGIGLYICHQIVKAHEGKISIKSEEGKGTEISFTIPDKEV